MKSASKIQAKRKIVSFSIPPITHTLGTWNYSSTPYEKYFAAINAWSTEEVTCEVSNMFMHTPCALHVQ